MTRRDLADLPEHLALIAGLMLRTAFVTVEAIWKAVRK